MTMYDFQHILIFKTIMHFNKYGNCNILLVSPTGSGKSFMASVIAKRYKRILYVAHRIELLKQFKSYFSNEELNNIHLKCINISSIHKITDEYDIIIIDEAHRSAARTYNDFIYSQVATPIIGLTATPQRLDGRPLTSIYDIVLESPSTPALQKMGYLLPFEEYCVPEDELPDLNNISLNNQGDYNSIELDSKFRNVILYGNVYREWKEKASDRKTIIYCINVKHGEEVCEVFRNKGINAANVSGKMLKSDRIKIYNDFKNGTIQVITNCMIYTEGIDIPDISCIVMMRPTTSVTLFLQQGGRGSRYFEGKENCIILDHANNINTHGSLNAARKWRYDIHGKSISSDQGTVVPVPSINNLNIIELDWFKLKRRFTPDSEFFNIFTSF